MPNEGGSFKKAKLSLWLDPSNLHTIKAKEQEEEDEELHPHEACGMPISRCSLHLWKVSPTFETLRLLILPTNCLWVHTDCRRGFRDEVSLSSLYPPLSLSAVLECNGLPRGVVIRFFRRGAQDVGE